MKFEWKGVFPAITTQFTADDQLDLNTFHLNLQTQMEAGIDGVILGGTLGEASTLTNGEKDELIRFTVRETAGRIPVIMNIAEQSTTSAIDAASRAEKLGAHGLMLLPPMRYAADDHESVTYFSEVARSTTLPIMLYNNPTDYKINITLDMLERLEHLKNIQAIKESSRDVTNVTRIRNAFGDRYKIFTGVDTLGMESLVMGADGWVAGLVCAFPKETVAIYRLIKAGRIQEALAIHQWFLPVLELDVSSKLVQNIKLAESLNGIGNEFVRAPRLVLQGKERERVIKTVNEALVARPELPELSDLVEQKTRSIL